MERIIKTNANENQDKHLLHIDLNIGYKLKNYYSFFNCEYYNGFYFILV